MLRKEHLAAKIFSDLTWRFAGRDNELFLTFDDGPSPEITSWALNILNDFDAKATFFCIGGKVEKYPDLYNQIIEKGHSVGNHGYLHMDGWVTNTEKYTKNAQRASKFIKSNLFRPAYGRIRPKQSARLKKEYRIIMWDVLSEDYDQKITGEECLQNVLKYADSGSIIVFHDTEKAKKNLKYALPKVLEYYSKKGFVFNSIDLNS